MQLLCKTDFGRIPLWRKILWNAFGNVRRLEIQRWRYIWLKNSFNYLRKRSWMLIFIYEGLVLWIPTFLPRSVPFVRRIWTSWSFRIEKSETDTKSSEWDKKEVPLSAFVFNFQGGCAVNLTNTIDAARFIMFCSITLIKFNVHLI